MPDLADKIIIALDVDTLAQAQHFVDLLYPAIKRFKVGSQLFTACGPEAVEMIGKKGAKVFLDLKFFDIPNTVSSAVSAAISTPYVFMITVHTAGGKKILEKAAEGAKDKSRKLNIPKPSIVGVTVLTSEGDLGNTQEIVLERAQLAKEAGLDGIVCSVWEAAAVRKALGNNFIIVTPGIRPKAASGDDQKRTATAKEAIQAGSDYLVIGRPVLEAKDPLQAARGIISEITA